MGARGWRAAHHQRRRGCNGHARPEAALGQGHWALVGTLAGVGQVRKEDQVRDERTGGASASPAVVFVFDGHGRCLAASGAASDWLGPSQPASVDDLRSRLRLRDGGTPDLVPGSVGEAVPAGRPGGTVLRVATDALRPQDGGAAAPVLLVRISQPEPDGGQVIERALGGILAHDLRTPLTTIYGGAQLVIDPIASEATRAEAARTVAREAQRMHDLIEDLVVLARFEPVDTLEPILLQRLLPGVVDEERTVRPSVEVAVELPARLPAVLGSPAHLEHAFRNLLAAALRGEPADGRVRIQGRPGRDEIEVAIVVAPEALPGDSAAFELGRRAGGASGDGSGVNLGPHVARRLVEGMGGRVWARAARDRTEWGLALPRAR